MLAMVNLTGYSPGNRPAFRRPAATCGHCQALANEPKVLLLDEPLGALDLKLRKDMQVELKKFSSRQVLPSCLLPMTRKKLSPCRIP